MNAPGSSGGPHARRPAGEPAEQRLERQLEQQLARTVAPLDKRALGLAFGITGALAMLLLTMASLLVDPAQRFPLGLLVNYFLGYTVSWSGMFMGALWAFGIGFCGGWFLAFCRNLIVALWLMKARIRADVENTRDFLDHI